MVDMTQGHLYEERVIGVIQETTICDDEQMIVKKIIDDLMKHEM